MEKKKNKFPPPYKYFLLRAANNSMVGANINKGDIMLIRKQKNVRSKDIVVAMVGEEIVIAQYHMGFGKGKLLKDKPAKNECSNEYFKFEIHGTVVSTIPGL